MLHSKIRGRYILSISFSIAVPVLGKKEYVTTALESIQNQSVDIQLAIMDATPDTSVQSIIDHYKDMITYSRHGSDEGQSAAIQEGWNMTGGDVLAWLCADDYFFPDVLKIIADIFEQRPEIDVVYGDSVYVDEHGNFETYFPSINANVSCLPYHNCIAQPSCFVRRKAIEKIGGLRKELHYIMDWDLWNRIYASGGRFYYLSMPLSVTRIYPDTKTNSMTWNRYQEIYNQLKIYNSLMKRTKAFLGTLHYDLSRNKTSLIMGCLYLLLHAFRRCLNIKKKIFKGDEEYLYGLELGTNRINDNCVIHLPWYKMRTPKWIKIALDIETELNVQVDDIPAKLHLTKGKEKIYRFPERYLEDSFPCDLSFQLHPSQPNCKLLSFRLE